MLPSRGRPFIQLNEEPSVEMTDHATDCSKPGRSMPVIPLSELDPAGRYSAIVDRLLALPPGVAIAAGQASSGKVTTLLALAYRLQRGDRRVVLFSDQPGHFAPFEPLPVRWQAVTVEPTPAAWGAALANCPDPDDLIVIAPLNRENAKSAVTVATMPRWVLVAVDTALAGLDLSYVLRDMGIAYADFADAVRWVWSILLLPALCDHCGAEALLGPGEAELLAPGARLERVWREVGCPKCGNVGTDGRVALSDITIIEAEEREAIKGAPVQGTDGPIRPELRSTAWDEARHLLAEGVIGLDTYREAIHRNPLLRSQHALQTVQARAEHLAKSLWLDLDVLTALAETAAIGLLVVDEWGHVSFANALAREATGAPGELAIVGDRVCARSPRVTRLLAEALRQAVQSTPRATRIPAPGGPGVADIYVTPLATARGFARDMRRLALLLVGRRDQPDAVPSENDVRQLFDLTPAESSVALQLCSGLPPKEIARNLGVSVATVRSQVSSLLTKTGTRRQVELVRLMSLLPRSRANAVPAIVRGTVAPRNATRKSAKAARG